MIENLSAAIADHHHRFGHPRRRESGKLMIEDRPAADIDEAFRHLAGERQQPRAVAGAEDDALHRRVCRADRIIDALLWRGRASGASVAWAINDATLAGGAFDHGALRAATRPVRCSLPQPTRGPRTAWAIAFSTT